MPGREKSKRRRKRRIAGAAVEQAPTGELAKSKADVVREQLVPLEEGERPLAVTVAAIVAAVLVLVYLVAFAVGGGSLAAGAPFVVVLLVAGVGMWDQPRREPVQHLPRGDPGDPGELVEGLPAQVGQLAGELGRVVADGVELVPRLRVVLPLGAHHGQGQPDRVVGLVSRRMHVG